METSPEVIKLFDTLTHAAKDLNRFDDEYVEKLFYFLFIKETAAEKESVSSKKTTGPLEEPLSVKALVMLKTERPKVAQEIAMFLLRSYFEERVKK